MWRLTASTAVAVALLAAFPVGQTKIETVDDYRKVMKSNAEAGNAIASAMKAGSNADARKALATVRENYVTLQGFWAERKRSDAVAIVKDGLSQIDAMDKLFASNADPGTVGKASQQFGKSTCGGCHALYREGDEETGFRFKAGVFDRAR